MLLIAGISSAQNIPGNVNSQPAATAPAPPAPNAAVAGNNAPPAGVPPSATPGGPASPAAGGAAVRGPPVFSAQALGSQFYGPGLIEGRPIPPGVQFQIQQYQRLLPQFQNLRAVSTCDLVLR